MTFAVVVFPGSNCDHDAYHAAKHVLGQDARFVWHKETSLGGADVVILPGGFSHGDYLRTGAIARFSPIMAAVARVRRAGRAGARHLQRLSDPARVRAAAGRDAAQPRPEVSLRVRRRPRRADRHAVHGRAATPGQVLRLPIAHGEGNYYAPPEVHRRARGDRPGRVPLRRRATARRPTTPTRTARSTTSPASATSARNVVGLMPHPERACERALGSARRPGAVRVGRRRARRTRRAAGGGPMSAHSIAPTLERHGLTPDEYDRIVELARPRAEPHRARPVLGDVVASTAATRARACT